MNIAPIVLFVYNRLDVLPTTVQTLQKNLYASESDLFIYSDGAKNEVDQIDVNEVRKYIKTIDGFRSISVVEREKNLGLAESIVSGITETLQNYDTVIVLEDDIETSPHFLSFMNEALLQYRDFSNIYQVNGHITPIHTDDIEEDIFFLPISACWGWATWKRAWDRYDHKAKGWEQLFNDRGLARRFDADYMYPWSRLLFEQMYKGVDSWAIKWYWSIFINKGLTVFPKNSVCRCLPSPKGTHVKGEQLQELFPPLQDVDKWTLTDDISINEKVMSRMRATWQKVLYPKLTNRLRLKLNILLNRVDLFAEWRI